jgi:hypothetical protein
MGLRETRPDGKVILAAMGWRRHAKEGYFLRAGPISRNHLPEYSENKERAASGEETAL